MFKRRTFKRASFLRGQFEIQRQNFGFAVLAVVSFEFRLI